MYPYCIFLGGGRDLRGGKGVSNQTTLHRKFMLFFLEQHILKSLFFYFYFFYCLNRAKCNIKIYTTNFV